MADNDGHKAEPQPPHVPNGPVHPREGWMKTNKEEGEKDGEENEGDEDL